MLRFAFQIFLSAFLLFQVQPIVARFILPDFGGASNVWTICLVFFQVFLLIGYLYAYLLDRWLAPFKQALVHSALVCVALLVFLPLDLSITHEPSVNQPPQLGIMLLLLSSIGLPYALISSSGPLFQNWFRQQYPDRNPYRLYALSNIGSLIGLLSYPFLIEPVFTLHHQALLWTTGFALYFVYTLACLWALKNSNLKTSTGAAPDEHHKIHIADAVAWVLMAAIATTLLLAITNKITLDVASVPFLWILPLTLYLLSFIICFDKSQWYDRRLWIPLLFIVTVVGLIALARGPVASITFQVIAYLSILFVGCMVCHGELYRLRPHPSLLTRYYLVISFGGATGGIFVALIAPLIFNDYFELQLSWVALFVVAGLCIFGTTVFRHRITALGAQVCWSLWIAFFSIFLFTNTITVKDGVLEQVRGFYGVLKVINNPLPEDHPSGADRYLSLKHGAITHGTEFFKGDTAMFLPTSYFTRDSGVGKAIEGHPDWGKGTLDVGVVGMGAASISALCKKCQSLSFYEIDPNVIEFERKWFTNLSSVRAEGVETDVFLGDARKILNAQLVENSEPQYDVLAIDAFSGDAIPVHLMTREAFELYIKHMRDNGVLAVHISNRHLDLTPVVLSLASDLGFSVARVESADSTDNVRYKSVWMLVTKDKAFLSDIESDSVTLLKPISGYSWTDEYSNLLSVLH